MCIDFRLLECENYFVFEIGLFEEFQLLVVKKNWQSQKRVICIQNGFWSLFGGLALEHFEEAILILHDSEADDLCIGSHVFLFIMLCSKTACCRILFIFRERQLL